MVQLASQVRREEALARFRAVVIVVLALFVIALAIIVWIAFTSDGAEPAAPTNAIVVYHDDWESAMRKAGVTADFPDAPVSLTQLEATGRHRFSATFSEDEVAALLSVYRFESRVYGDRAALDHVEVDFPKAGYARLTGRVTLRGDPYLAYAAAPVRYDGEHIVIEQELAQLSVEGISVGGRQRERVVSMVSTYVNDLLVAAPGLSVKQAAIVPGGVRVVGSAPDSIGNPTTTEPPPLEGLDVASAR